MAHATVRDGYRELVDRLNRFPQGAPPSDLLLRILALLMSEPEAGLVSQLPLKPFEVKHAARRWEKTEAEAERILDELASRALLLDVEGPQGRRFVLPPPMAGFFEFSLMRVRPDVDQKALAELFFQYINVEEDFIKDLMGRGETQLGRVFVSEDALTPKLSLQVLDFERASRVIGEASCIGVGTCYCRHKMAHLDRACDAPMEVCMTLNGSGASLVKHGHAKKVDKSEAIDILQMARDRGLVQFGENVQEKVNFICNCCGCCCEAMIAARRFAHLHPVHTTAFIPELDLDSCNGCGKCVDACPVAAMGLVSAEDPEKPRRKKARLDASICLGCGVCVGRCPQESIALTPREERTITPVDSIYRTIVMAVERGTLQHLIFDNRALHSHRAMAAILGAILRLPPLKRVLASGQLRSRYVEEMLMRHPG